MEEDLVGSGAKIPPLMSVPKKEKYNSICVKNLVDLETKLQYERKMRVICLKESRATTTSNTKLVFQHVL